MIVLNLTPHTAHRAEFCLIYPLIELSPTRVDYITTDHLNIPGIPSVYNEMIYVIVPKETNPLHAYEPRYEANVEVVGFFPITDAHRNLISLVSLGFIFPPNSSFILQRRSSKGEPTVQAFNDLRSRASQASWLAENLHTYMLRQLKQAWRKDAA